MGLGPPTVRNLSDFGSTMDLGSPTARNLSNFTSTMGLQPPTICQGTPLLLCYGKPRSSLSTTSLILWHVYYLTYLSLTRSLATWDQGATSFARGARKLQVS